MEVKNLAAIPLMAASASVNPAQRYGAWVSDLLDSIGRFGRYGGWGFGAVAWRLCGATLDLGRLTAVTVGGTKSARPRSAAPPSLAAGSRPKKEIVNDVIA